MAYDLHAQHFFTVWPFPGLEQLHRDFRAKYGRDPEYIVLSLRAYCEATGQQVKADMKQETDWNGIKVCWDANAMNLCYLGPVPERGSE